MSGKSVVIMSCPQMQTLAEAVVSRFKEPVPDGRRHDVKYSFTQWGNFANLFPKLKIDAKAVENKHVWFFASFDNPTEIFRQMAVIYALPQYGVRSLKVILPYYPTGTDERIDHEGEIATAVSLARIIGAIPLSANGPAKVYIFDIHALQERHYFSDFVIPILKTSIPTLIGKVCSTPNYMSVAFPDEGASKRFGSLVSNYKRIICQKVRQGDDRIVTIKEGDVSGHNINIVDDLTRGCGTLIECARALKRQGAGTINMIVSHSPFDPGAVSKLVAAHQQGLVSRFVTTDSCPEVGKQLAGLDFVTIVSLRYMLEELIINEEFE